MGEGVAMPPSLPKNGFSKPYPQIISSIGKGPEGTMIERYLEDRDGIIIVRATGEWSLDDVASHYSDLRRIIDDYRSAERPVRVLSDVSGAPRQSAEIEAFAHSQIEQTYRPGDRIALLVANSNEQEHARVILGSTDVAAFSSRLAAEIWLMSEDLPAPSCKEH